MKKLNLSALANNANNSKSEENETISSDKNIVETNLSNNNNLSENIQEPLSENKPKKKIVSLKAIGINNEKKVEDENIQLITQKDEVIEKESLNNENKITTIIPKISFSLNGSNLKKQTEILTETENIVTQEITVLKDQESKEIKKVEINKEEKIKISDGDTVLDFIQTKNSEIFSNYKSSFVLEEPKKEQKTQNIDFLIDNTNDNKIINTVNINSSESESINIFSTNSEKPQNLNIINITQTEAKSEDLILSDEGIIVKNEVPVDLNILETEKISQVVSETIENIDKKEILETEKIEVKKEIEKKPEINKINTNLEKYKFKKILKSKLFYFSTSFGVMLLIFLGFLGYIQIPGLENISGINKNLKSNINENLTLSGELVENTDENLTFSGELVKNTDENLTFSGELVENTDENLTSSGELVENTDENLTSSGELVENTDQKIKSDLKLKKYLFKKYIN